MHYLKHSNSIYLLHISSESWLWIWMLICVSIPTSCTKYIWHTLHFILILLFCNHYDVPRHLQLLKVNVVSNLIRSIRNHKQENIIPIDNMYRIYCLSICECMHIVEILSRLISIFDLLRLSTSFIGMSTWILHINSFFSYKYA